MSGGAEQVRSRSSSNASETFDSGDSKPTWSEHWTNFRAEYLNKEGAKSAFYIFMSLLVFLAVAASLATAIYVGVLAISPIAGGLALTSALGIPAAALTLVGTLLLVASIAALLRFVQIHLEMYKVVNKNSYAKAIKGTALKPLRYAFVLFTAAFVMDVSARDAITIYHENATMAQKLKHLIWGYKYQAAAMVAALVLGIAIAVPLLPYVMGVVMASFGLPYGLAVLFGAAAAATVIAITYQLLASLTTLKSLYNLAKNVYSHGVLKPPAWAYFSGVAGVLGVAMAAGAAYLFFPALIKVLTPVLAKPLATFLAIAVSLSLTVGLMKFLPALIFNGPSFLKASFYDKTKLQSWMNDEQRLWARSLKEKEEEEAEIRETDKPRSSSCFWSKKAEQHQEDDPAKSAATWRTCWRFAGPKRSAEKQGQSQAEAEAEAQAPAPAQ